MVRRLVPKVVAGVALALSGLALSACGDDAVTRDEFIAQLQAVTSGPDRATKELAGCIYDQIADDPDLLEEASRPTSASESASDRLSKITRDCWAQERTDEKGRTTTTRPSTR